MPTTTTGTTAPAILADGRTWLDYPGARDALERIRNNGAEFKHYSHRYARTTDRWSQYEGADVTILNDARFMWLFTEADMGGKIGECAEREKFIALHEQQPTVTQVIDEALAPVALCDVRRTATGVVA